jgi:hypothetical protein
MDIKPLRRVNYSPGNPRTPSSTCHRPEGHELEFQQFHYLTDRLHNAALHGAGVALGLEVVSAAGSPLTIRAGVAIDADGRMIVNPMDLAVDTTTATAGTVLPITIRFNEVPLRPDSVVPGSVAPCGRIEQQPTVALLAPVPPDVVVLGSVVVDSSGKVQSLTAAGRQLVGQSVGSLRVRRMDDQGGQGPVTDAGEPAGTLAPASGEAGLRIDVPHGPLQLGAETVTVEHDLHVAGATELNGPVKAAGRDVAADGQALDQLAQHVAALEQATRGILQRLKAAEQAAAALTNRVAQAEQAATALTHRIAQAEQAAAALTNRVVQVESRCVQIPSDPNGSTIVQMGSRTILAMQGDGNLVIYRDGHAVWTSNTNI